MDWRHARWLPRDECPDLIPLYPLREIGTFSKTRIMRVWLPFSDNSYRDNATNIAFPHFPFGLLTKL